MTHQAPANKWSLFLCMMSVVLFSGLDVSVVERFCLCDGRTDTMRENNDHLVGQYDLFYFL